MVDYLAPKIFTNNSDVPSIMLDVQYRMHPTISRFPSEEFYNFDLLDGTTDGAGSVSRHCKPPNSSLLVPDVVDGERPGVLFLHHELPECGRNRSRANDGESLLAVGIIEDLLMQNPVRH
jgi:superfamily I DNA and/or RNA helicase